MLQSELIGPPKKRLCFELIEKDGFLQYHHFEEEEEVEAKEFECCICKCKSQTWFNMRSMKFKCICQRCKWRCFICKKFPDQYKNNCESPELKTIIPLCSCCKNNNVFKKCGSCDHYIKTPAYITLCQKCVTYRLHRMQEFQKVANVYIRFKKES
jgi:hypothetical protein